MKKFILFVFSILLFPQFIFASILNTGDAYSESSMKITTDEEFVVVQDNQVSAVSNTGNKSDSAKESSNESTAVSEVNIQNGTKVKGELKVEANGEKKVQKVDKPGSYKLEINNQGEVVASSEPKTKQNFAIPIPFGYLERFLNFLFGFFKK